MIETKKVFILEDEAIIRAAVESILIQNNYSIVGSYASAEKAIEALEKGVDVDVFLLDIELAGEQNGIWFSKQISRFVNAPFIYLTSFTDPKTIEEIKQSKPSGYLRKPFDDITLVTTLDIAISNFFSNQEIEFNREKQDDIFIQVGSKRIKIDLLKICFLQAEGNYVRVFFNDSAILIRKRLVDFIEILPKDQFIQVHRKYIARLEAIQQAENHCFWYTGYYCQSVNPFLIM